MMLMETAPRNRDSANHERALRCSTRRHLAAKAARMTDPYRPSRAAAGCKATCASILSRVERSKVTLSAIRRSGRSSSTCRRSTIRKVRAGIRCCIVCTAIPATRRRSLARGRGRPTSCSGWTGSIVEQRMPPAILVLVDGFTRLGGSQYVNSIHNGDYATYVDARRRRPRRPHVSHDRARRRPRGVGKIVRRIRRDAPCACSIPGRFAAFASHSGDSYFRYAQPRAFADTQRTLEKHDCEYRSVRRAFEVAAQALAPPNTRRWRCSATPRHIRPAARRHSTSICRSIGKRARCVKRSLPAGWRSTPPRCV